MKKHYKVLYIEDNEDNRILIKRFLEFEGFEVVSVETGTEGLTQGMEILPDVFLIDLNLPDISGFEVIEALNSWPETKHIPKVAFSAGGAQKARQALPSGPIFFLEKPVDIDSLAEKIRFAIHSPNNTEKFVL